MHLDVPNGSWTHSFEEDEAGFEVYRPTATFAFPPGRKGRQALEFGLADGVTGVTFLAPGPDDRPHVAPGGALHALGQGRYADDMGRVLEIVEATPAILKLVRHRIGQG
ncbi:hypothetical protein [Janthinobacterium sp. RB2R34]|uniref:hypothetical protein n=1 Tax=Janthinobacterium sp. RB2R34 TaxID=3424193 RepID=UPI003F21C1B7